MGVIGLEVEELYGLDAESIASIEPKALIFLFKWDSSLYSDNNNGGGGKGLSLSSREEEKTPFYAPQTVNNACATMALLNSILNIKEKDFLLGNELKNFKEFALQVPVELRGDLVRDNVMLRLSHNHFARPEQVIYGRSGEEDKDNGDGDEDPFHFISLTPFGGELWELDGLSKNGPISHGSFLGENNWYDVASKVLYEKIQKIQDGGSEIRFSLMGIRRDRLEELEEMKRNGNHNMYDDIDNEIRNHLIRRKEEEEDNVRRTHNWVPLAMKLIEQISNF